MNMRNWIKAIGLLYLLSHALISWGQNKDSREKIEAAKIGLISERLGLTPEEAERFWPIYNEYNARRQENHREFQQARKNYNKESASDAETRELLELGRRTKEKQLNLDREYSDKLLGVISDRQLLSLHEAEREFRDMLLRRLENRGNDRMRQQRPDGPDREQLRRENQERMRQNRNN